MKLIELFSRINESKEYLPIGKYGAWVNAETKEIHPVEFERHQLTMTEISKSMGDEVTGWRAYRWANDNHFVRIVNPKPRLTNKGLYFGELVIDGNEEDIKKAWPVILPTAKMTQFVGISKNSRGRQIYEMFDMPEGLSSMNKFVNTIAPMMTMMGEQKLLEYKEHLHLNKYGAWIDSSTNTIIDVEFQKHANVMKNIIISKDVTDIDYKPDNENPIYNWGYQNGYVRILHHAFIDEGKFYDGWLGVCGQPESIKAVWPLIKPTAMRTRRVEIAHCSEPVTNLRKYHFFDIPGDRPKLSRMIENPTQCECEKCSRGWN